MVPTEASPRVQHQQATHAAARDVLAHAHDHLRRTQPSSPLLEVWPHVERFYEQRGFVPAWQSPGGHAAAELLRTRMAWAADDGLPPARYRLAALSDSLPELRSDDAALVEDAWLTAAILRYAHDLAFGPAGEDSSSRSIDVATVLAGVADAKSAHAAWRALQPDHPDYARLKQALREYRAIADAGGWPSLPDSVRFERQDTEDGMSDAGDRATASDASEHLLQLCRRLAITGDLSDQAGACAASAAAEARYDVHLEQAVRHFQRRHGLIVDGIVGPNTIRAINVPASDRVRQIEHNMHRWRQQPDALGARYVRVNIAGFFLHAVDEGRRVMTMKVVAGEPETPTPVMQDTIEYLVFRPYWNVPASITQNELLPRIARDPSYLAQQRFEIVDGWSSPARVVDPASIDWTTAVDDFPYRLRQRPGPANSLGLVKFMFPNNHAVYLHDTPATHRFEARRRAFSHGCVRVEDPVALAEFLLADPEWTPTAIRDAMQSGGNAVEDLKHPVPVYLTYFTTWVEDGVVQFRRDIYGLDASAESFAAADTTI